MLSVTTEAATNVSVQGAQPSSQRGGRSSDDAFGTLVDASAHGSPATVAKSNNSRDQFNVRPAPRPNRIMPEPAGGFRASSARPPQTDSAGVGRDRQSSSSAQASSGARRRGIEHDDPEIAPAGNASGPMQAASATTDPGASPDPAATPPAAVVPVIVPVAGAPAGSATQSVHSAAELPPVQQTDAMTTSPANIDFDPALATDSVAVTAAIIQETPDTQYAAQATALQTGGALAAAVVTTAPGAAKATAKSLDNAPPGRTEAPVAPGIQPEPESPVSTAPPGASGNAVSPRDAGLSDRKHDAAEHAKNAASDTDPSSTQPVTPAPHPARAPDAAATQPQAGQIDGQSINNAVAPPQIPSNTTTPATTPQYNVAAAAGAAVPLNGLAVQIAVTALSGKSRFEIRLDPADLGRIDVRLDVDRQGRVTSHLMVEKPETLAMLRQDAPQLQRALQDAGLRTGDGGLQFSLRDQSSQGQNARDDTGRNAQRLIVTEEDTVPAASVGRDYGRVLESSRGLDIRV